MAKTIEVLVIDDSAFMRKVLQDILDSTHDIKVVGTAKNGLEALDMARELHPDVITLDLNMPSMDGLTCLRELQNITDTPVIMLSSLTVDGGKATIEALESGAIDFITKPSNIFDISGEQKKDEIIKKIHGLWFQQKKQTSRKRPDRHRRLWNTAQVHRNQSPDCHRYIGRRSRNRWRSYHISRKIYRLLYGGGICRPALPVPAERLIR